MAPMPKAIKMTLAAIPAYWKNLLCMTSLLGGCGGCLLPPFGTFLLRKPRRRFAEVPRSRALACGRSFGHELKCRDFTDAFYARQGEENSGYVTDAFLGVVDAAAGVDPDASSNDTAMLDAAQVAAEQLKVQSTRPSSCGT